MDILNRFHHSVPMAAAPHVTSTGIPVNAVAPPEEVNRMAKNVVIPANAGVRSEVTRKRDDAVGRAARCSPIACMTASENPAAGVIASDAW